MYLYVFLKCVCTWMYLWFWFILGNMEFIFKSTLCRIHVYGYHDITWSAFLYLLDHKNVSWTNNSSTSDVSITLFSLIDYRSHRCAKDSRKIYICWISSNGSRTCLHFSRTMPLSKRVENTCIGLKAICLANIRIEESRCNNLTAWKKAKIPSLIA